MSRVMVVDDEPDIQLLVRLTLERAGHSVVAAPTGERALDLIEANAPDVLILDIGLPGIDGWEVLSTLRAGGQADRLGVIILSANAAANSRTRAKAMGCAAYLRKPFSIGDLVEAVQGAALA